jgi:thiamine biosynthesis lipoprotein
MYTNYYPASQLFHGSVQSVMGTRLDALLFGDSATALEALWQQTVHETRRLERLLSRFDAEGDLYRINRDAAFYPVTVTEELWGVLQDCRRYFELTDGCFDVTRGRFPQVEFDDRYRTVYLKDGATVDLGGCGKGYALRRVRQLLERAGVRRALVNFGDSSVLAVGAHPHGDCWPVGVRNPYTGEPAGSFRLRDASLSVSGNTPARGAHIVRPETGHYVTGRKCVAAVAADPVEAEVLTTALMAAGREQAAGTVKRFDIKEYKIYE